MTDDRITDDAHAAAMPVTRDELLAQLTKLLPAQFDEVLFRARLPPEHLSESSSPQATRAIEMIRALEPQNRLPELARAIEYVITRQRDVSTSAEGAITAEQPPARSKRNARRSRALAPLIGTGAIMPVVIGLGVYLGRPQSFDLTVFLHGKDGHQAVVLRNHGKVSLDLGADRRIEAVGNKGEVRFAGIPGELRDREVALGLDDATYELVNPALTVRLDQDTVYAAIQPRQLALIGDVSDDQGRALPGARVVIATASAVTDQKGHFEIKLPADLPEGDRTITITAAGYEPRHYQAAPGGNAMQVPLSRSPERK